MRADMAARVDLQPSDPALIFYPYKQRPGLGGWVADDRASTFVVVSHDGSPQLLEAFRLKDVEEQRNSKKAAAGQCNDCHHLLCGFEMFLARNHCPGRRPAVAAMSASICACVSAWSSTSYP